MRKYIFYYILLRENNKHLMITELEMCFEHALQINCNAFQTSKKLFISFERSISHHPIRSLVQIIYNIYR